MLYQTRYTDYHRGDNISGWSAAGGQGQSAYVRGGFQTNDSGAGHSVSMPIMIYKVTIAHSHRILQDLPQALQSQSQLASPQFLLVQIQEDQSSSPAVDKLSSV